MGRKRTKNLTLPDGMRARTWSSGKTYYYLEIDRKTISLGDDKLAALEKYCELVKESRKPARSWLDVANRYQTGRMIKKAKKTQDNESSWLSKLNQFFATCADIDTIKPSSLKMYKAWRIKDKAEKEAERIAKGKPPSRKGDGKVAVNRELTLFSMIWKYAREEEFTTLSCPAESVDRFKEHGRKDVYTEDEVLEAVYKAGDQALKDALDLAYLTGQRRADVLAMTETMIRPAKFRQDDGSIIDVDTIPVKQEKTGNKIRMIIDGDLKKLIDRIVKSKKDRKVVDMATAISKSLLVNEDGQRLTMQMLRGRFQKARKAAAEAADASGDESLAKDVRNFQFRDLRAKAGSDKADETGSMLETQKFLGHSAASTTETYVRHRRGALVKPTR